MTTLPPTILVVDDELPVRTSLEAYLQDRDFNVLLAESGEDALEVLKREKVNVAIVDIRLPGMDGHDFIRETNKLYPSLKYLVHTGSVHYTIPSFLTEIGIYDHDVFSKPLTDANDIVVAIHRHLQMEGEQNGT